MISNANSVPSEAHANTLFSVSDAHMDVISRLLAHRYSRNSPVSGVVYSRKAPQDVPHTKSRDDCKKHVDVNVVAFRREVDTSFSPSLPLWLKDVPMRYRQRRYKRALTWMTRFQILGMNLRQTFHHLAL